MYVALYKGRSWTSKLIRWFTRSEYSHAAWVEKSGKTWESWEPGGVRTVPSPLVGHDPRTPIDFFFVQGMDELSAQIVSDFFAKHLGKPYDFWGVIGFISRRSRQVGDPRWFCSEILIEALRAGGINILAARLESYKVTPRDVAVSPLLIPATAPNFYKPSK
jgi:uncharacterized protein YycO